MRQIMKLIALLCLAMSPLLVAAQYRFVTIDFPGSVFTQARGINALGDIVGSYTDTSDVAHAFLLRKGVYTNIDVPNAAVTLGARAINAQGDIVGSFLDASSSPHGYLLSDGQFTQIDYPGASGSFSFGINNAGHITGSHFDASGNESGFIFKGGVFKDVHVPGSFTTAAYFAQDNGQVLVGDTMDSDGHHGFIRIKPGAFQLIDFPGTSIPCTGARWINQQEDIVGFFTFVDDPDDCTGENSHGFLFRNSQYTQVDFPRSIETKVLAINDDGILVGSFTDKNGHTHGFKAVPK